MPQGIPLKNPDTRVRDRIQRGMKNDDKWTNGEKMMELDEQWWTFAHLVWWCFLQFPSSAARRHGPLSGIPSITSLQWPMRPWVPRLLWVPIISVSNVENWWTLGFNHQKLSKTMVWTCFNRFKTGFHQQNPIAMQAAGDPRGFAKHPRVQFQA